MQSMHFSYVAQSLLIYCTAKDVGFWLRLARTCRGLQRLKLRSRSVAEPVKLSMGLDS